MPGCRAVGSSRLRVVTATLLGLLMRGVLVAPPAVLAELDPVRIVLLVLQSGVVAPFADATGQRDDVFHSCLFGGEKEKSLGFLGAVNTSRHLRTLRSRKQGPAEGLGQPGDVALLGPCPVPAEQTVHFRARQGPHDARRLFAGHSAAEWALFFQPRDELPLVGVPSALHACTH